jgi:DNA-binding FrmR family transcriptional regulator
MSDRTDDIVEQLRAIEEALRDLAYDRLRDAAQGDTGAAGDEKRLQQARRAVERAVRALGGAPEDAW